MAREERRIKELNALVKDSQREWPMAINEVTDCSLCLEQYAQGDVVLKLPWCAPRACARLTPSHDRAPLSRTRDGSGHIFHLECVSNWFDSKKYMTRSCPVCRQNPLISDEEFAHTESERFAEHALYHNEGITLPENMNISFGGLATVRSAPAADVHDDAEYSIPAYVMGMGTTLSNWMTERRTQVGVQVEALF